MTGKTLPRCAIWTGVLLCSATSPGKQAAKKAGDEVKVPFTPGRTDASKEQTDVESFAVLEPTSDAFRYHFSRDLTRPAETLLVERADVLAFSTPEMKVLAGGLRALNANTGNIQLGVFTKNPETPTNDFFVNLLDMNTERKKSAICEHFFDGRDAKTGKVKWTASSADLVFGSKSQLRAIAEVYANDDSKEKFVRDLVAASNKVMKLDRFDLDPVTRSGARSSVSR